MFTKETTKGIIEDCRLRAELFREEHGGRSIGSPFIRVSIAGVDGGGLSTYGKSATIGEDDHYECHDDYLYIHSKETNYKYDYKKRVLTERVMFIPYESIIAIECSISANV